MREKILEYLKNANDFISGETLSRKLELSRTAVWKHVNKLRDEGYEIISAANKGYRLISSPNTLSATEIKNLISSKYIGNEIKLIDSVDSTNSMVKKEALKDKKEGYVLIARKQTKGKGRLGRSWDSAADKGLYMSILLRPGSDIRNIKIITLAASLAVCNALNSLYKINSYIKWPNDVLADSQKICGILTEAELTGELGIFNYIILGIGINVYHDLIDFNSSIAQKATSISLKKEKHTQIDINKLCGKVIMNLDRRYSQILKGEDADLLDDYRKNLGIIGCSISFMQNNEKISGIVSGVDKEGQLEVKVSGRKHFISSGEISLESLYGREENDN